MSYQRLSEEGSAPVERLGLAGVLKVSQAVSGEIVLDRLVETLLRTAIEQAGAERGLLILPRGGELSIQAEAKTSGATVTVRLREKPASAHELPESLVRHAARTQENVILDDALARNPFSGDEYIREARPRSVLCLPLVKQGVLVALLYMENNVGPGFFSPERIVVLKVLASQAAISLDNSRLYRELQEREGRIRRLVDANIIGILISDSRGEIIESNDAFLRMVGYTREEVVSGRMRWRDMTPPEWKEASEQGVVQVRTTGACKAFEKEYFRKDGSRVPVLVGAARFEENSTVAFAVDLTELKRTEETLRRSQHYLAEAQKASHTGSWAWSTVSNAILYWSDECYRISGFDPAQGLPSFQSSFERIHPEDRPAVAETIERALREKAEFQVEYRNMLPAGPQRNVRILAHPVLDASGKVIEFIGTVMDVTEQKRAEEERREHLWFLESMDRIDRAMQRTNDFELMMSGVVQEALAIFDCDRAWLVYPCDPDSPTVRAVMEHTSPGYPGAFALDEDIPVDARAAESLRRVLHAPGAVTDLGMSRELRERFSIHAMIAIVVRPKRDRPYMFGLHQCSRPRTWSAAESRLFEEIARRLEDVLTSVLAHRNLLASEEESRRSRDYLAEAQKVSHTGSWAISSATRKHVYMSDECFRIHGRDPAQGPPTLKQVVADMHPDDRPVMAAKMNAALHERRDWEGEYRLINFAEGPRTIRTIAHPVLDQSGQVADWIGTAVDITDQKRAEEERREHLWFLESMDRINRAMQRTNDVEAMMSGVLEETLAIFGTDRARLVYPCDPDAPSTSMEREHTRPEYPGPFALREGVPMDPHAAQVQRRVLDNPGALMVNLPQDVREQFRAQTAIAIAVRPKGDRPYLFAMHQCSHARTWTAAERRLFEEIARRLEDALTSVLAHRNLLASEEELRRSRAYLAEAQKVSHTGSWAWNPASNAIVYWSEECYRILGHDPANGLPSFAQLMDDVHPEDRPGLAQSLEKAVAARSDWKAEYRLVNFADGARTVRGMAHPILTGAGEVLEYVGTVMDITERKRREQCVLAQHCVTQVLSEATTLEQANRRVLEALCEALDLDFAAVWCVDADAHVLKCADTWSPSSAPRPSLAAAMQAEAFGPGVELPGRTWSTGAPVCVRDIAADRSSSRAELAAREGLHAAFAFPISLKSGFTGVIELFSREVRDADPEFLQMMTTVASHCGQFVERVRAEDALRTARTELAHVTRVMSLGELTASIAHEVNQPLGAMVTSAASAMRWLAAHPPNLERASLALARIAVDGERASAVIDRMRMLVKRQEPGREPIDVNETILSVMALMRDEMERAGIAHAVRLADKLPRVLSDRVLLQQVILNLVLNAVDAMRGIEDRARVLRIESRLDKQGEVRVEVRDTGRGLPPDARLFEAFYTTKERGLGMGLSISRSIVEADGGRMQARPNEPHGAIFEFSLPVPQA